MDTHAKQGEQVAMAIDAWQPAPPVLSWWQAKIPACDDLFCFGQAALIGSYVTLSFPCLGFPACGPDTTSSQGNLGAAPLCQAFLLAGGPA
eukprot:616316-Pelagomonas_calceolata.AAC.3